MENGRAKACEKYPDKFCRVVLEAFKSELAAEQIYEFGEPLGKPCRASCGCMGQCEKSILMMKRSAVTNEQAKGVVPRSWTLPFITAADQSRGGGTTGMPDERAANILKEWQRTVDVTHEFNAMIGSLNQLEASSNHDLYQNYDFVNDVSNKQLKKKMAIDARMLEI